MSGALERLGGALIAAALVALAWAPACDRGGAGERRPEGAGERGEPGRPGGEQPVWSAQLHLHGPFSEGAGSTDSQAAQARDVGVDVLWWSDHDFRIGSYRLASTFGFEGPEEPIDLGEPWSKRLKREDTSTKGISASELSRAGGSFEFTTDAAIEGQRSLRLRSSSRGRAFRPYLMSWVAKRSLHRRTLASEVSIELAVLPEHGGPDGRAVVYLELSEHAPHFLQHALKYYLAEEGAEPELVGTTYNVPLPYEPGQWNEYTLDVNADLRRGFPGAPPGDNVLFRLELGVETRAGAEASALFDRLRISSEVVGPAAFEAQRELLAEHNASGAGPRHLQGLEVSYEAHHLNEFSLATTLPDYDAVSAASGLMDSAGRIDDARAFRDFVTRHAVQQAHARGGLISYNHMFGAGLEGSATQRHGRGEILADLLANEVFGADILEVGYRDRGGHSLDDHLWVWDRLAVGGLRLVGSGVSDYHGGSGADAWRTMENNFVSWIHADEPTRPALLEGLRSGRVFFGDIVAFDGRVDIQTAAGFRMGDVVVTDRRRSALSFVTDGLAPGDRVRAVGPEGVLAEWEAAGGREVWEHELELGGDTDSLARLEVRRPDGAAVVFSNPIWFVRAAALPEPGAETPPRAVARARVDVAGVRDRGYRDLSIHAAAPLAQAEGPDGGLALWVTGDRGWLTLELGARQDARVVLAGLSGDWRLEGGRLELEELTGSGRVEVRW